MRCVICNGENLVKKKVEEEIKSGRDVVLVPLETLVCEECGERYYDRRTMQKLEEIEAKIREKKISLAEVGHVLKPAI